MTTVASMNPPIRAHYIISFDGSARPNPGEGGWGAVIHKVTSSTPHLLAEVSSPVASKDIPVTSNVAEYHGLIGGLRFLLRHLHSKSLSPRAIAVQIKGDSELVIRQLTGAYGVRNDLLKRLHALASGLVAQFGSVTFTHIPREENHVADALAAAAIAATVPRTNLVIYYPNLCGVKIVSVAGKRVNTSNDFGAAGSDKTHYVDASFLASLPSHGFAAIGALGDPHPVTLLRGKVDMQVLGTLPVFDVLVSRSAFAGGQPMPARLTNVLVVDPLPVPLHISLQKEEDDVLRQIGQSETRLPEGEFVAATFPAEYHSHPYWAPSDVAFMPYLQSDQNVLSMRALLNQ